MGPSTPACDEFRIHFVSVFAVLVGNVCILMPLFIAGCVSTPRTIDVGREIGIEWKRFS